MPGSIQYTRYKGGDSLVVKISQIHITETMHKLCHNWGVNEILWLF